MNPLTEARNAITDTLKPLGVTVYPAPPASLTPPAAIVGSGAPWVEPLTFTRSTTHWVATLCATQTGENEAAYERLEGLVWSVVAALRDAGMAVEGISQVRSQRYGQAEVAAVDIEVRVDVDDQEET